MDKTMQDELREICKEKDIVEKYCGCCVHEKECHRSSRRFNCLEAAADTLLAALDARRLEIVRKGEK